MPDDKVLKRADERKTLFKTIVGKRKSAFGHLLCRTDWFTTLVERRRYMDPGQDYMDEIKGRSKYEKIKGLSSERKKL